MSAQEPGRAAPAGTGRDPQFDQLGGSISTSSNTSVEAAATILDIALFYIRRGWNPVPIPFKKKKPIDRDWQKRIIDEAMAPRFFNGGSQNIGIQLGPSSHGLTDLDLDCAEAVALAPYILPPTGAIFGRASKRRSHWLYTTDLSIECDTAVVQFKAPDGRMLLELRIGGGGKGAQTVFPGSTHENGETVSWEMNKDGEPAEVDGEQLTRCAKTLAAATLIARTWPAEGSRHRAALVVGGVLARAGMGDRSAAYLVEAIARAAGDCEWRDRAQAAKDAVKNSNAGGKTPGFSQLAEIVGKPAAQKIAEWLDYRPSTAGRGQTGHKTRVCRQFIAECRCNLGPLPQLHAYAPIHLYAEPRAVAAGERQWTNSPGPIVR